MDSMKGQMFIIIAIIVVTVMVLLKTSVNLNDILRSKTNLESDLSQLQVGNILNEQKNNLVVNYLQNMSMMNNVFNFTNFSRAVASSNAQTFNAFIVGMYIANTSANANTNINVTVANFLGSTVNVNITFTYNNSVANFTNLADASAMSQNFTFNTSANTNYTLLVNYGSTALNFTNITLPITIGNSYFVGFYDLRLTTYTGTYTSKFQQNVTLAQR